MSTKIRKRFMVSILSLSMMIMSGCQAINNNTQGKENENSKSQLQVLKSDAAIDKYATLDKIKAEYLVQHKGYSDKDKVKAIVEFDGSSLSDYYLNLKDNKYASVGDYANSIFGQNNEKVITLEQTKAIEKLRSLKVLDKVEHSYKTIINAIAISTTYGSISKIGEVDGIKSVSLVETYNLAETKVGNSSPVENQVDVYETGIFDSSDVEFTGAGTAVAVLDSGFDCSHSVFAEQPKSPIITPDSVSSILANTNAAASTAGLKVSDVYYSDKIPFVYDYADKDADVTPYDSEHGTHVAGIIGGHDDTITGVATNTQMVLMKVFPNLDSGASTDDILEALEDAVLLEVDAINMSLGSACGFTREEDGNVINAVYDRIEDAGISLVTACSNNYSSGYGSENGNTSKVTNPDSATVGSPSTYNASLSVASISGTKSEYIVANGEYNFFFNQANNLAGDSYDFFDMLEVPAASDMTLEYVTIPGVGLKVNYSSVDVKGKIALVKRGNNTFEEKAQIAFEQGAVGCIIYNNIAGDILMSMGKAMRIPTISISRDDGTVLAKRNSGTLVFNQSNLAGPFMSDFSSWGPSPDLSLKPEITAHGGNILSSVPGGGYDTLSGTSMASPNMCGIMVLLRQYIKEKYPDYTAQQVAKLANQLIMSTATIALDEFGNPYSPRKQGAGLASIYKATESGGVITVDDNEKAKLELGDDPQKTGIYEMNFNIQNISSKTLSYELGVIGMTESVSTSDKDYVAEADQLLNGSVKVESASASGNKVTVAANSSVAVKVTYTLSDADKKLIDEYFTNGMYVEGYVTLKTTDKDEIDLNVPFLGFYGDWTKAPLFDKTYYEVEEEKHDNNILEEDKLKADYFATTPYGSYFGNYIIPLGTYIYDMDTTKYNAIPASEERIAVSDVYGAIDGFATVYGGVLRNAREMRYTITNTITGEVVFSYIDYNANKAFSQGGTPIPYYDNLNWKTKDMNLVNNGKYRFDMVGIMDYGEDGGLSTNENNSFGFDFTVDNEAPIVTGASYEKIYDKTMKKDRYYITLTVYDNNYAQSIHPIIFTSNSTYTTLEENPIPVYGEKGSESKVRFEITEYLDVIYSDAIITSSLAFLIDDYAVNSNIFLCQLPGTNGSFSFTDDGTVDGEKIEALTVYTGETVDLTQYLSSTDIDMDTDKDYLKYLNWEVQNTNYCNVKYGEVTGLKPGVTMCFVSESLYGESAYVIIVVKDREAKANPSNVKRAIVNDDVEFNDIKFTYFDTLYAFPASGDFSEIGSTGSKTYFTDASSIICYPGESVKIHYAMDPWYLPTDRYELRWVSSNSSIASVDSDGTVKALKKGSATISLRVIVDGKQSNIMASTRITVKSEFVIENRVLTNYKGLGGDVVIPDDEGILYIGPYAFANYETDNSIVVTPDDYDANKIPVGNSTITSITVPYGVEDIQKYAFYNLENLVSVTLPKSIKYIREYAFYNATKLQSINFENTIVIGANAFYNCDSLTDIDISKVYAIGDRAFANCTGLKTVNLNALRNSGIEIFKNTTGLETVTLNDATKLSYGMFVNSGLKSVVTGINKIPEFCFANCASLTSVTLTKNVVSIGEGAFSGCKALTDIDFQGEVEWIYDQAFYNCVLLRSLDLPNGKVKFGSYVFYMCTSLTDINFGEKTEIVDSGSNFLAGTKVSQFNLDSRSKIYKFLDLSEGKILITYDESKIVFVAPNAEHGTVVIPASIDAISPGAFSGITTISSVVFEGAIDIGAYAFANCSGITSITFNYETTVGAYAFQNNAKLTNANNIDKVTSIGAYSFSNTALANIVLGNNLTVGEGAFFKSGVRNVTLGANTVLGLGVFQRCTSLITVNMPSAGGVVIGDACFSSDTSLQNIDLSKTSDTIGNEAFYGCTGLTVLNLANVKYLGNYAFSDCASVTTLSLPVIVEIGEGAFSRNNTAGGAPAFKNVILPNTLKVIGDGAFMGCESLTNITIPNSVDVLGQFAFAYCLRLEDVVLPSNIDTIQSYTFAGCTILKNINTSAIKHFAAYSFTSSTYLTNVDLSSAIDIGYGAFASTNITNITDASNLVSVGAFAFQNGNIASFDAPKLEIIGEGAFYGNNMTEFIFSRSIKRLDAGAFIKCASLTKFGFYDASGAKKYSGQCNDYLLIENEGVYVMMPSNKFQFSAYPAGSTNSVLTVKEGTYRVEVYAGSENPNVTKIVLPDSLRTIGSYAFYGMTKLNHVEFKSFTAPILESTYIDVTLTETDPGYDILHEYFDMFGHHVSYTNFIGPVGKNNPIKMTLPNNDGVIGYDNLIFKAYFGGLSKAERSNYIARNNRTIALIDALDVLPAVEKITLKDETKVIDAITAYNSVNQDLTTVGFTAQEVRAIQDLLSAAQAKIKELKYANLSEEVKAIQEEILSLNTIFSISMLDSLKVLSAKINALSAEDKALLDLTKYNQLVASYEQYINDLESETTPVVSIVDMSFVTKAASIALVAITGIFALVIGVSLISYSKRRFF